MLGTCGGIPGRDQGHNVLHIGRHFGRWEKGCTGDVTNVNTLWSFALFEEVEFVALFLRFSSLSLLALLILADIVGKVVV